MNLAIRITTKLADDAVVLCYQHEPEQIRDEAQALTNVAEHLGIDIYQQIEDLERQADEKEAERPGDPDDDDYRGHFESESCDDPEIEDMFQTLRDDFK
jgi:hypothetical protein